MSMSGNKYFSFLKDLICNQNKKEFRNAFTKKSCHLSESQFQILTETFIPTNKDILLRRNFHPFDVFALGGGGGFNQVTLKALQMLGVNVAAGVPSTDDGGSTGKLQKMIEKEFGYMFGVGDAAAILEQQLNGVAKQPILSFRPPDDSASLTEVLITQIKREMSQPSIESHNIADCPDFISFSCNQINLARVIDDHFLGPHGVPGFSIKGASIRNLNILAAFYLCKALSRSNAAKNPHSAINQRNAEQAWFFLETALGLSPQTRKSIPTIPVSYDRACIWAKYAKRIPTSEISRLLIPEKHLSKDRKTVYGQQYIDKIVPAGKIIDFGVTGSVEIPNVPMPAPTEAYLKAMRSAKLIIMGAGSLFGSQLAQLTIPGIIDEFIRRKDIRKVLVVNHVCMDETTFYSLTDHIKAIERIANKQAGSVIKRRLGRAIRIGDIFTDIVVPRTVAREIDIEISNKFQNRQINYNKKQFINGKPMFVTAKEENSDHTKGILINRYTKYVFDNPSFRKREQVTDWELRVLGFLEQPICLNSSRMEAGRYRGAVYALDSDIKYIVRQGISKRHIYEVESISMNKKILKAEGKPQIEEFPGLIPEALVGIFKILLVKGVPTNLR
jgi:2-phospho-L-lactate transferase/gluconeogenesis factor (CofD/UPF0052 family)